MMAALSRLTQNSAGIQHFSGQLYPNQHLNSRAIAAAAAAAAAISTKWKYIMYIQDVLFVVFIRDVFILIVNYARVRT